MAVVGQQAGGLSNAPTAQTAVSKKAQAIGRAHKVGVTHETILRVAERPARPTARVRRADSIVLGVMEGGAGVGW